MKTQANSADARSGLFPESPDRDERHAAGTSGELVGERVVARPHGVLGPWLGVLWWGLRRFRRGDDCGEVVETTQVVQARPERCWKAVIFYEEIGARAPWLLRAVLPSPVRAEGKKSAPGARVDCVYTSGYLTKRILELSPPHRIVFDVVESYLGIEDCVAAVEGAYVIRPIVLAGRGGSEITLSTRYRTALGPRWIFRPLEAWVLHALHRHVLHGLERGVKQGGKPGGLAAAMDESVATDEEQGALHDADRDSVSAGSVAARGGRGRLAV